MSEFKWKKEPVKSIPPEYKAEEYDPDDVEEVYQMYPASANPPVPEENIPKGIEDQILPQKLIPI